LPNQSAYGLIPAILICAPRFVGRDFSSMPSATIACRRAMTVCSGACTPRPASVRTVSSRSRVTATIPYGSAIHIGVVENICLGVHLYYEPFLFNRQRPGQTVSPAARRSPTLGRCLFRFRSCLHHLRWNSSVVVVPKAHPNATISCIKSLEVILCQLVEQIGMPGRFHADPDSQP
jgi:hypothetical protein